MSLRLIVGLGNPGLEYYHTRHNMGFLVLESFAAMHGLSYKKETRFLAKTALLQHQESSILLLMPQTYMNLSGESVRKVASFYKITPEQILVIFDDIALPFGKLRLKEKGSDGGHKGVRSLQSCLNTQQFPRLKIGIGHPPEDRSLEQHVLGRFTQEEQEKLPLVIEAGIKAIGLILQKGVFHASADVNRLC